MALHATALARFGWEGDVTEIKTSRMEVPDALSQFRWMAHFNDKSVHLGIGPTEEAAIADLKKKFANNQIVGGAR
jgi:hypothetical protein